MRGGEREKGGHGGCQLLIPRNGFHTPHPSRTARARRYTRRPDLNDKGRAPDLIAIFTTPRGPCHTAGRTPRPWAREESSATGFTPAVGGMSRCPDRVPSVQNACALTIRPTGVSLRYGGPGLQERLLGKCFAVKRIGLALCKRRALVPGAWDPTLTPPPPTIHNPHRRGGGSSGAQGGWGGGGAEKVHS